MYRYAPNLDTRLIQLGELLEDGRPRPYYHTAIALDVNRKIEAQGKTVAITEIDYGNFEPFRPPLTRTQIEEGLSVVLADEGEPYDWPLIIDDGLRYLTHNLVHLPVGWITSEERRKKICSSLVVAYFKASGWRPAHPKKTLSRNSSPEDVGIYIQDYPAAG